VFGATNLNRSFSHNSAASFNDNSHWWDLYLTICQAIADFENKTGLCVTELRPVRKGDYTQKFENIDIVVDVPDRPRSLDPASRTRAGIANDDTV